MYFFGREENFLAASCPDAADGSFPRSTEPCSGIPLKKAEFVDGFRKQAADSGKTGGCLDGPPVSERMNSQEVKRTTHIHQQSKCG